MSCFSRSRSRKGPLPTAFAQSGKDRRTGGQQTFLFSSGSSGASRPLVCCADGPGLQAGEATVLPDYCTQSCELLQAAGRWSVAPLGGRSSAGRVKRPRAEGPNEMGRGDEETRSLGDEARRNKAVCNVLDELCGQSRCAVNSQAETEGGRKDAMRCERRGLARLFPSVALGLTTCLRFVCRGGAPLCPVLNRAEGAAAEVLDPVRRERPAKWIECKGLWGEEAGKAVKKPLPKARPREG